MLDLPEFTNVEKYLWLEEKPTLAVGAPDILTELLAEPDLEGTDLGIENTNNSTQPLLKGGAGGVMIDDLGESILSDSEVEQSDFLVRWRQKKDKLDKVALIPTSRKFWGRDKNDVTGRRRVKLSSLATRQWAGFLSAGFLIYL